MTDREAARTLVAAVRRHLVSGRFRDPLIDVWTDRHGTHLQMRWTAPAGRVRALHQLVAPWPPRQAWAFDALARAFLTDAEAAAA